MVGDLQEVNNHHSLLAIAIGTSKTPLQILTDYCFVLDGEGESARVGVCSHNCQVWSHGQTSSDGYGAGTAEEGLISSDWQ